MTGLPWLWRGASLAAAIVCLGAAEKASDTPEPRSMFLENFALLFFVVLAMGIVVWAVAVIRKRIGERRTEEEKAAKMLEAQVMSLVAERRTTAPQEPPARSEATGAALPSGSSPSPQAVASPMVSDGATAEPAQRVEAILRSGGLLVGLEGSLYLSDGQSEGKIIRLRDGKTAVVLPQLESAEFLARQIKRFDLCIVALGGDQTCIISPLGTYIADHIAM
jgi:cytoskeletal protein RodZ